MTTYYATFNSTLFPQYSHRYVGARIYVAKGAFGPYNAFKDLPIYGSLNPTLEVSFDKLAPVGVILDISERLCVECALLDNSIAHVICARTMLHRHNRLMIRYTPTVSHYDKDAGISIIMKATVNYIQLTDFLSPEMKRAKVRNMHILSGIAAEIDPLTLYLERYSK